MSTARTIIDRAREAGLPAELAEQFERDLVPRVERFLAITPEHHSKGATEEGALLREVIEAVARIIVELADAARTAEAEPAPPKRVPGAWKGRVRVSEDFDAPLPEAIERGFYDSVLEPETRE